MSGYTHCERVSVCMLAWGSPTAHSTELYVDPYVTLTQTVSIAV